MREKWINSINEKTIIEKRLKKVKTTLANKEMSALNKISELESKQKPTKVETKYGQIVSATSVQAKLRTAHGKQERRK